jgi:hypothetical protein
MTDWVEVRDLARSSPPMRTDYKYQGGMAWHSDVNPYIPAGQRNWAEYRGFAEVEVTTGAGSTSANTTTYRYMRGMDGDINSHDPPHVPPDEVTFASAIMPDIPDSDRFRGRLRESWVNSGTTGGAASEALSFTGQSYTSRKTSGFGDAW